MPAEDGGNLLGGEPERGAQPDTQDALVFRLVRSLFPPHAIAPKPACVAVSFRSGEPPIAFRTQDRHRSANSVETDLERSNRPQTFTRSQIQRSGWQPGWSITIRRPEGLTRGDILNDIALYWLTITAISSARLYWASELAFLLAIPVAVSVFSRCDIRGPAELGRASVSETHLLQQAPKGGYFAAWEQPELFVQELRAAFKSMRWSKA